MSQASISGLPETAAYNLSMFLNCYDLAALSLACRGTKKMLRSRVIWTSIFKRDYGYCVSNGDVVAADQPVTPSPVAEAPAAADGVRSRKPAEPSSKASIRTAAQAEAQAVKDIKNQYYFEWKLRKTSEEEAERRRRTPWIEALAHLRTHRPRHLPREADILRVVLDVVFYLLADPLLFGLTAFGVHHFATFLDGHNYHNSKIILEASLCSVCAWVWICLVAIASSMYDNNTHSRDVWFCQGIASDSSPPRLFATWLKSGASVTYQWDYTTDVAHSAWKKYRRSGGWDNPEEFPAVLFAGFVFFNWMCLLLCSSAETNLTFCMESWWYIGQIAAYIVWACNVLPLGLFLFNLNRINELQFERFATPIVWTMGVTLGMVASCWVFLQRWILCHIQPYAITNPQKNVLQRADEWVHAWSVWIGRMVADAFLYLVSFVWTFESKEGGPQAVNPASGPIPTSWHWRYTNESTYCASGTGLGNWLFQGYVPPMGAVLSLVGLTCFLWWIIRMATLQWRGRLSVQHYISNGVDIAVLPLILATLWRVSDCEGKASEIQNTGFFNRDFNDESVPTTWNGCTQISIQPLLYCLALLSVRGMCRGFAILMEVRKKTQSRHLWETGEGYVWLYPPVWLAWARVICTGSRKPVRRNVIDVR